MRKSISIIETYRVTGVICGKNTPPIEYKFAAKAAATILQPTLKLMQNSGGQDEAQRNRDFDPHYHG